MKLTGWYLGDQKPVRNGVYKRKLPFGWGPYSYWNGVFWGGFTLSPSLAKHNRKWPSCIQNAQWRGVKK